MRKILFTVVLSMAVITASFHAQVKKFVINERKANKSINIVVSTTNSYHLNAYKYCEAKLDYTVLKIRGNKVDTVAQKQIPEFKLKDLSSFAGTFSENIQVKDVVDRKERVVVLYNIIYLSKGSVLKVANEKLVPVYVTADTLTIKI